VAAGILPAVEGGILPPGKDAANTQSRPTIPKSSASSSADSAGLEARLYGWQDACRHGLAALRLSVCIHKYE